MRCNVVEVYCELLAILVPCILLFTDKRILSDKLAQGCILDSYSVWTGVYFGCMYGPPGSEVRVFSNVCFLGVEGWLALFGKYTFEFEADFYLLIDIIGKCTS